MSESFLLEILQSRFQLPSFREGQLPIINAVLAGQDVVAVMPTGGGKSLCYQLPALVLPGLTLVVSPLIALMKDQVDGLRARGIEAAYLNSSLSPDEQGRVMHLARRGGLKLLYVAPERFKSGRAVEALRDAQISLFAVDEAPCVSQWGHDFRPDYLRLGEVVESLGRPPTAAFTATATPDVRKDIVTALHLKDPALFFAGIDRPNLFLAVSFTSTHDEKLSTIREVGASFSGGSGIVYCSTRKNVDKVYQELRGRGGSVLRYHAGLDEGERSRAQLEFMTGTSALMVATNAFGMGVDKPDIRYVIHFDFPGSLEAYYQEVGRAGRDGKPSLCVTTFSYADRYIQERFVEGSNPPRKLIEEVFNTLVRQGDTVELTTHELTRQLQGNRNEMAVTTALQILDRYGAISRGYQKENLAQIQLEEPPTVVAALLTRAPVQRDVVEALGTLYPEDELVLGCALDLDMLARRAHMERDRLQRVLHELDNAGLIHYQPPFRGRATHLSGAEGLARVDWTTLAAKAHRDAMRVQKVIDFAYGNTCRKVALRHYFGVEAEPGWTCGSCDRCVVQPGATPRRANPKLPKTHPVKVSRPDRVTPSAVKTHPERLRPRRAPAGVDPDASVLENALRRWRKERASRDRVKPFMILHDSVLEAIAERLPATSGDLLQVKGFGRTKLQDLGDEILEIVAEYGGG